MNTYENEVCVVCGSKRIENSAYGKKNLIWWRSCLDCHATWDIRKTEGENLTNFKK